MKKEILFDEDLRKKFLSGAEKIAKTVGSTLGPCGRFVSINEFGTPLITKDGVSVAKAFELQDPFENTGALLMREISAKTNETVGDGTTTSLVLGYEMVREGYKAVEAGCQPIELKRGIDKMSSIIIEKLKERSAEVGTQERVREVATISANNDSELGKLIADAFEKVGKDGIVNVETTRGVETTIEISEGLIFDEGWLSSYFINNKEKGMVDFSDALILLTDKKITRAEEIEIFLNESVKTGKPLLMICDGLEGEAFNVVVLNCLSGVLKAAAVKCPSYGSKKKDWLDDIAVLTGATLITDATGAELKACGPEFLGGAKNIEITKTTTCIVGGNGDKKVVEDYVNDLKKLADNTENKVDAKALRKRIAKFSGSAATIKVGAGTDTEAKEIKDRVDDAVCAVRAALDSGIVDGGGFALALAGYFTNISDEDFPTDDMKRGAKIVLEAVKTPLKHIAENAGYNGDVVYDNCFRDRNDLKGFDAKTGEYVYPLLCGIIDPTKVEIEAVKNASSIAGVMLTTNSAICKIEEEKDTPIIG